MPDRATPITMGTFPRHAEFCAAFLPDPELEDCALPCDCGLDEMRSDLKKLEGELTTLRAEAVEARSQGLEEAPLAKLHQGHARILLAYLPERPDDNEPPSVHLKFEEAIKAIHSLALRQRPDRRSLLTRKEQPHRE